MSQNAVDYVYLNVGIEETFVPEAVEYAYIGDVTEPPSSIFFSDGLSWFNLPTKEDLTGRIDESQIELKLYADAKARDAKEYTDQQVAAIPSSSIVLLETGASVSPNTPVNTIIFEKGVGLRGWWDGAAIQPL